MGLGLGVVRLGAPCFPGFRLPGEVVRLSASIDSSSVVSPSLETTRFNDSIVSAISSLSANLSVSNEVYFDVIISATSVLSPILEINRPLDADIDSVSTIEVDNVAFVGFGNVTISSISSIDIAVFSRYFVSDLGTVRLSPLSSPGFDFFVPDPPDTPLKTTIAGIALINSSLDPIRAFDASIDSVSDMSADLDIGATGIDVSIPSASVISASVQVVKSFDLVIIDGSSILVSLGDIIWPATLPQSPLIEGYSFTKDDVRHRTKMDIGPDIIRRKAQTGVQRVTYPIIVDTDQKFILRDFYRIDLRRGQTEFLIKLARETSYSRVRFLSAPRFVPLTSVLWRTDLDLEVLPI